MKLIKLTALTSLLFVFVLGISSCEKIAEKKKTTDYQKNGILMTAAQEVPANTSTALGIMDVFYSKETRLLTWSVTWTGLTGPVSLMHIHGLAPKGYSAGVVYNIITPSNGLATPNPTLYPATGKFSGTMLADGVIVKEPDLLNGFYYMNIHTAANPGGEIRGQIVFQ
ncbi:MAG TPA: CHRD domain-containing protein [Chitinophagaceae bacterium]